MCKHSVWVDVVWKPASRVFPSSVKYNHLDSPAFLPQSMERCTSGGTFRAAAVRQTGRLMLAFNVGKIAGTTVL